MSAVPGAVSPGSAVLVSSALAASEAPVFVSLGSMESGMDDFAVVGRMRRFRAFKAGEFLSDGEDTASADGFLLMCLMSARTALSSGGAESHVSETNGPRTKSQPTSPQKIL